MNQEKTSIDKKVECKLWMTIITICIVCISIAFLLNSRENGEQENVKFNYQTKLYEDEWVVKYTDKGAVLYDESGDIIFGPCRYIYQDYSKYKKENIIRYIDEDSGLIGYAIIKNKKGSVLVSPKFVEADKMIATAWVKEGQEVYCIDKKGNRFTKDKYLAVYPFEESQGCFARVQKADGYWYIIDREEKTFLSSFDWIDSLPYVTTIGSGIKNGKAIVFDLNCIPNKEPEIIKEYTEYNKIIGFYAGSRYAVVALDDGAQGVICPWDGKVVIDTKLDYQDIQWYFFNSDDDEIGVDVFVCKRADGSYDVIEKERDF